MVNINEEIDDRFIGELRIFLFVHGTESTDINKLLDYAKQKTGLHFNNYGVECNADRKSIKISRLWGGHSFFDDGGGYEGRITWSITFEALDGDYLIQNEKLEDLNPYRIIKNNPIINDEFYCKDPFGLKGIYKISFCGWEESTD